MLVLTQYGTIESAVEATRLGAADYITKPFHIPELRSKLDRLMRLLDVDQENRVLRETLRTRPGFGGSDRRFAEDAAGVPLDRKVSQHAYPVLILGESGTGRNWWRARCIFRACGGTSPSFRWIVLRWCPL